jgi:hypothetical protein
LCPLTPEQLAPTDLEAWRVQRRRLQNRHQARVLPLPRNSYTLSCGFARTNTLG